MSSSTPWALCDCSRGIWGICLHAKIYLNKTTNLTLLSASCAHSDHLHQALTLPGMSAGLAALHSWQRLNLPLSPVAAVPRCHGQPFWFALHSRELMISGSNIVTGMASTGDSLLWAMWILIARQMYAKLGPRFLQGTVSSSSKTRVTMYWQFPGSYRVTGYGAAEHRLLIKADTVRRLFCIERKILARLLACSLLALTKLYSYL